MLTAMANESTDPKSDHEAFYELLKAARTERRRATDETSGPALSAVLEFAQARGWTWARDLATASVYFEDKYDDALVLLSACESQIPAEFSSCVQCIRGYILAEKGDVDVAIEAFRNALAQPGFLKPAIVWFNLGWALAKKREFDAALDAYHKALEPPGYACPGSVWNNIGIALARKGDVDDAIDAFHKALGQPEYETRAYAWTNLGNALYLKDDLDGAIEAYRKAIADPNYNNPVKAWTSLGEVYAEAGRVSEARDAFEKALALPDKTGWDHDRARSGLSSL
jgi:Tfp pilus assembly protein PilF